jgi:membrane protein
MTVSKVYAISKKAGGKWLEDKAMKMSAALAYNTITAIAPLLMVALLGFTIFYKQEAGKQIEAQLASLTDPKLADSLATVIQAAMDRVSNDKSIALTLISLAISIFGASGVFGELQDSLNTIWGVKPIPHRPWWSVIKDRIQPILLVCGIAFMLLASTAISTAIDAVSGTVIRDTIGTDSFTAKTIGYFIDIIFSMVVLTGLFTAMFKVLPDVEIGFRDTLLGGFVTAVLFEFGKYALSAYMVLATPGSTFGAVGSIVVFLVWVNYSAYILFFGAEFTQVYATTCGSRIKIADNAEPVAPEKMAAMNLQQSDRAKSLRPVMPPRLPFVPPPDKFGKRVAFTLIPSLAGATLVRLTVKRIIAAKTKPVTPPGEKWREAGRRWKDVVLLRDPDDSPEAGGTTARNGVGRHGPGTRATVK